MYIESWPETNLKIKGNSQKNEKTKAKAEDIEGKEKSVWNLIWLGKLFEMFLATSLLV